MRSPPPKAQPRDEDPEDRLRLILHVILPYAPFGLLRNQQVVSPPLALVAAAPQLRVYCEESAPYSLGGTWWLAHTTAHCVVDSGGRFADADEVVFTGDDGASCTTCNETGAACDRSCGPHTSGPSCCWLSEDSFVRAAAKMAYRQHPRARHVTAEVVEEYDEDVAEDVMDVPPAAPVQAAESIMARHTGTMALVPPQLSSNCRLLSYVRGVPPSFLSFCLQAAQHGWKSAARTFLSHYTALGPSDQQQQQQQRRRKSRQRLFVVHTQLYAICGYPESRIAHSMWWCLRRLASANAAHALPTATLERSHHLSYRPSVFATGESGSEYAHGVGHARTDAASLRRLRAAQQGPALLAALERSAEQRDQLARRRSTVSLPAVPGWVTTSSNLIVSGDITFWSGTSTVSTQGLVPRHWNVFFKDASASCEAAAHLPSETNASAEVCNERLASELGAAAAAATVHTLPPPPPACALFLHGSVVLAVEHKLHRDAANARARRQRAQHKSTNDKDLDERVAGGEHAEQRRGMEVQASPKEDEGEDEPALDVQPLFFDMVEDAAPSPPHDVADADDARANDADTHTTRSGAGHTATSQAPNGSTVNTTDGSADIIYDPYEERFLGELVHRHAFELLHCLSVRHLRLPLGSELVATAKATTTTTAHARVLPTTDDATGRETWDARWLSCLFPRVEVLDVEGPPSVNHSFRAAARGTPHALSASSTAPAASAASTSTGAGAAAATSALSAAGVRRFRPVGVRPRGLALSLGAAAAAQTQTGPLYTMDGLWRLRRLRQVVLRAYPFEVLPRLTPMGKTQRCRNGAATLPGGHAYICTGEGADAVPSVPRQHAELSVMGWPYVTEAGLRSLVQEDVDELVVMDATVAGPTTAGRPRGCNTEEAAPHTTSSISASPRFSMLSLTHMDSTTFVEALEALFVPPCTPPPRGLPHQLRHVEALAQLTQLELSKTRITTDTLARLDLPHHTTHLRVLRLSSTGVDSVCSLYGLTHLQVLNLASTPITPAGLRLAQWMPALEELFLTQCESLSDVPVDARRGDHRAAPLPPDAQTDDGEAREDVLADVCAVNIFSLGTAPDPDQLGGFGRQPFAALRILDLSNIQRLTQGALVAMRLHGGPCERDNALAASGLVLSAQVTQYAYSNNVCTAHEHVKAASRDGSTEAGNSDAWQPSCFGPPRARGRPPAWMPRLHTLYLMHTSITRLDCLLELCPRLRALDVSYTPLRDDGLYAQVWCPETLPHVGHDSHSCGAAVRCASRCDSTRTEGGAAVMHTAAAASTYVAVAFPAPLRLELLNCTGTQLTTLLPLSRLAPLDWCYTTPPAAAAAVAVTPPPPYASSTASRGLLSRAPSTAAHADAAVSAEASMHPSTPPPPYPLCLHPHPAIGADLDTEVHLRTQEVWLRRARHTAHHPHADAHGQSASSAAPVDGHTVRQVDTAHWWASLSVGNGAPRGSAAVAATAARSQCFGSGIEGAPFELASQWTPHAAARTFPLLTVPGRRRDAEARPLAVPDAPDETTEAPSELHRQRRRLHGAVRARGGVVRYGVVALSAVRRLRLGQTEMTAGGLAAGFGMPQCHMADTSYPDVGCGDGGGVGLTELSLRHTPFLCLPPRGVLHQHPASTLSPATSVPQRWTDAAALCAVLRLHRETLQVLDLSHTPVSLSTFFDGAALQPGVGDGPTVAEQSTAQAPHSAQRDTRHPDGADGVPTLPSPRAAVPWEEWITHGAEAEVAPVLDALLLQPHHVLDSLVMAGSDSMYKSPPVWSGPVPGLAGRPPQRSAPRHAGVLGLLRLTQLDVADSPLSNSLRRLFHRLYHRVRLIALRTVLGAATQPTSELSSSEVGPEEADDPKITGDAGSSSDSEASDSEVLRTARWCDQQANMKLAWATLLHHIFGELCTVEY